MCSNYSYRYIAVNQAALFAWWRSQRIDEDEYGGTQALMGEGLPPSIGLFLVSTACNVNHKVMVVRRSLLTAFHE